jgi:hypothetical protein
MIPNRTPPQHSDDNVRCVRTGRDEVYTDSSIWMSEKSVACVLYRGPVSFMSRLVGMYVSRPKKQTKRQTKKQAKQQATQQAKNQAKNQARKQAKKQAKGMDVGLVDWLLA